MDDHVVVGLELEMRDVEGADGVHRGDDGAVALFAAARGAKFLPHLAQCAQHAGTIESLTFTVFAKTHRLSVCVDLSAAKGVPGGGSGRDRGEAKG